VISPISSRTQPADIAQSPSAQMAPSQQENVPDAVDQRPRPAVSGSVFHRRASSTLAGLQQRFGIDPEEIRRLRPKEEVLADETEEAISSACKSRLEQAVTDLALAAADARAYRSANLQPDECIYQHDKKNLARMIAYLNASIPGLFLHAEPFDTPAAFAAHLRHSLDEPRHERALVRMGENSAHYAMVDYMIKDKRRGQTSNAVSVMGFDAAQIQTMAVARGIGRLGSEIRSAVPHAVASYTLIDAQKSPQDCIVFALLYATKLCLRRDVFKPLHAKQLAGEPIDDGNRPRDPANANQNIYIIKDGKHFMPADFYEETHSQKTLERFFSCRPEQKDTKAGKTAGENFAKNLLRVPRNGKVYATTIEEARIALTEGAIAHFEARLEHETSG
jgi:hypothetical protein